jgi:hypothetical protein
MSEQRSKVLRALTPGLHLMGMASWVVLTFIASVVVCGPLWGAYWNSFVEYYVVFAVFLSAAALMTFLEWTLEIWARHGFLVRWLYLLGFYAAGFPAILKLSSFLDSCGIKIEYFGSDPEGSFMMLYLPTLVLYSVVGFVFWVLRSGLRVLAAGLRKP